MSRSRRRATGDEAGAELVETAIGITLLLLLVFGIIEFGFVFFNNISLNHGVKETARQAAVACYNGTSCTSSNPADDIAAYAKSRIGLTQSSTRVHVVFQNPPAIGQEFIVCAYYPRNSLTGLLSPFINGQAFAMVKMRVERLPTSGPLPASYTADADPTGNGWSRCA